MPYPRASFVIYNLVCAALGIGVAMNPPEFVSTHTLSVVVTLALLLVACGFLLRALTAARDEDMSWLLRSGRSDYWSHAMRSAAMGLFAFHSLTSGFFNPPLWFTMLLAVASLCSAGMARSHWSVVEIRKLEGR
jgi:hypothetical protein